MAKRVADNDLNHDNWDQDEESEQAGVFKKVGDPYCEATDIRPSTYFPQNWRSIFSYLSILPIHSYIFFIPVGRITH